MADSIFAVLAGLFGLLLGSFLNVCIVRLPRDLSVVRPRSYCPACRHQIAWYDNIPVLSYLILRGRCRNCHTVIHWRYLLVELTTGLLFFLVVLQFGLSWEAGKWAIFACILTVLFWTDFEARLLPDELTLGGILIGLGFAVWVPLDPELSAIVAPSLRLPWSSLFDAASATVVLAGPLWLLGEVYWRLRKREGLGLGDVKLVAMMSTFLGVNRSLITLIAASVGGSVISLFYLALTKKDASTYRLPFGTFLCGAGLLAIFWGSYFARWLRG